MATFYSSSTNQRDILPTLYGRDSDASVNGSVLYLNYPSADGYTDMLAGNNHSHQNFINLPVTNIISQNSSTGGPDLVSWRDGRNEEMLMQTMNGSLNGASDLIRDPISEDPHMAYQNFSLQQSNVSPMQGQGLSLSLGTQIPVPSFSYHQTNSGNGEDSSRNKNMHMNPSAYGFATLTSTIRNSKYLKAAEELLDEVVNVRNALRGKVDKSQSFNSGVNTEGKENDRGSKSEADPSNPQESTANSSSALSPSERQDLQNKITKLLAMLDEVDRRYKQYYHQMQIVVASFDNIAGGGAAKPYTALALQTISRHFRCLRDAINGQIRSARKSLGEEDSSSSKGCGISRLRYIDQQIRQQRAMQQLGMQPHAWRPQRGLPENSVSILRAWLFEHFLHPYPKDSEKLMLARQTGLTRSQVSNWFINARVRLWKPMIEEMHKEELGDAEMDSNSSSGNATKGRDENKSTEDREDLQSAAAERSHTNQLNDSSTSNLMPEPSTDQSYMNQKLTDHIANRKDSSLLHHVLDHTNMGARFMTYHEMPDFGNYGNAGVSLTLGLQRSDGSVIGSNGQNFLSSMRGEEMYGGAPALGADSVDYDCMNLMDSRQRFGSSQILHDFVA